MNLRARYGVNWQQATSPVVAAVLLQLSTRPLVKGMLRRIASSPAFRFLPWGPALTSPSDGLGPESIGWINLFLPSCSWSEFYHSDRKKTQPRTTWEKESRWLLWRTYLVLQFKVLSTPKVPVGVMFCTSTKEEHKMLKINMSLGY